MWVTALANGLPTCLYTIGGLIKKTNCPHKCFQFQDSHLLESNFGSFSCNPQLIIQTTIHWETSRECSHIPSSHRFSRSNKRIPPGCIWPPGRMLCTPDLHDSFPKALMELLKSESTASMCYLCCLFA